MVRTSYMPTEYQRLDDETLTTFFSSDRAESGPSSFCVATSKNGWKLTVHKTPSQQEEQEEDEADIRDSLEALNEPRGISHEDLKRDLGI